MAENLQLPEHLRNRQRSRRLSDVATLGIGAGLPPHVSIRGNQFTLIDASGNEAAVGNQIDAVIVDLSDVMCKMFYGQDYVPGSNQPPLCWSTNGKGPSRDAIEPQHPTCADCPNNIRGSAVSKLSGASIKACRDEKHAAIYVPDKAENMLFRLVITPGSFKNWAAFSKPFSTVPDIDIGDVICRIGFEAGVTGVLTFEAPGEYINADIQAVCDRALASHATDALVGRNDVPYNAHALSHTPSTAIEHTVASPVTPPESAAVPGPAGVSSFQPAGPGLLQGATQKRHRRTKAEIEAARAAEAQPASQSAPAPQSAPASQPTAQPAPFRQGNGPAFGGIRSAPPPDANVKGMLHSVFKRP